MMRLSPRLICFIGTSGLLQSALASQEGEKDAIQWQTIYDNQEQDVGLKWLKDQQTGHRIFKYGDTCLCNIYEVSHSLEKHKTTIRGTICEYLPGKVMLKAFDQTIEFHDDDIALYKTVDELRQNLISARLFRAGKFRNGGKDADEVEFHSKANKQNNKHEFRYNLNIRKFKDTAMSVCRDGQGRHICLWRDSNDNIFQCKWMELSKLHIRCWQQSHLDKFPRHQAHLKVTNFETTYAFPVEYIAEGIQKVVDLKKGKYEKAKGDKKFLHFFLTIEQYGELKAKLESRKELNTSCNDTFRNYVKDILPSFPFHYRQVQADGSENTRTADFFYPHESELAVPEQNEEEKSAPPPQPVMTGPPSFDIPCGGFAKDFGLEPSEFYKRKAVNSALFGEITTGIKLKKPTDNKQEAKNTTTEKGFNLKHEVQALAKRKREKRKQKESDPIQVDDLNEGNEVQTAPWQKAWDQRKKKVTTNESKKQETAPEEKEFMKMRKTIKGKSEGSALGRRLCASELSLSLVA